MMEKIIQRGAEAVLIQRGKSVLKRRVKKGYRLNELDDKLRKRRTKKEARLLGKAGKIISIPAVEKVDERKMEIEMEFISGEKLSESLDGLREWKKVCRLIGEGIAKLHDDGIIHGDLTTSNMIWVGEKLDASRPIDKTRSARELSQKPGQGKLYFIDFGLGFGNGRVEDKAVDLHLIRQALEAKHFEKFEEYWKEILEGYGESEGARDVLVRLEKVEKRGRYKQQF